MRKTFTVEAIAIVRCSRRQPVDDNWDNESSVIVLDGTALGANAAAGFAQFSHIEVAYIFDRVTDEMITTDTRHPRGNRDWPAVGILAQRGKNRLNRLGITVCQVVSVIGDEITVQGLDAIDGTPIIDIKPVMSGFLPRGLLKEPDWAVEIMHDYW